VPQDNEIPPDSTVPDPGTATGHWPLTALGWSDARAAEAATLAPDDTPGRVVRTDRGRCLVAVDRDLLAVPTVTAPHSPAVGDWVTVHRRADELRISAILERRSTFARGTAEAGDEHRAFEAQILAANVDLALVIQAAGQLNPRRLERELLIVGSADRSAVVVTKLDLITDVSSIWAAFDEVIGDRPLLPVSSTTGEGLDQLRRQLTPGTALACFGASGVGKSTLINALLGADQLATGEIRANDGRGRHTTTARELFPLGNGVTVIDMPGVRSLTTAAASEDVDDLFEDVARFAVDCRFADCGHASEPGCAVRSAVEDGQLSEGRLVSYGKLQREAARQRRLGDPLEAQAEQRQRRVDGKRHRRNKQSGGKWS